MPIRRWSAVQLFIPTPQYQPLSTCAYPRRPELRAELFCRRMEGTVSTAGTRTKYLVMQNQNPGSESEQVIQNMWCDGRVPTNPAASPVSGIVFSHHTMWKPRAVTKWRKYIRSPYARQFESLRNHNNDNRPSRS
jgi:hypothetical protein